MRTDRLAHFGNAGGCGITGMAIIKGLFTGFDHLFGSGKIGLANLHMNYRPAFGFKLLCPGQQVHHIKRHNVLHPGRYSRVAHLFSRWDRRPCPGLLCTMRIVQFAIQGQDS